MQYLKQLSQQAGHDLDLTRLSGRDWLAASISSHSADYGLMTAAIAEALEPAK